MSESQRERDLVLKTNEYAYVLDKTKGNISCVVGPFKMSLSTSDAIVCFNEKTKKFEEVVFGDAAMIFVSAPENWYVELKNPVKNPDPDNEYPVCGNSNIPPKLDIGRKINIRGNVSFALYPGQMAKVIQGHRLHSNQYLLARVYDADVLMKSLEAERAKKAPDAGGQQTGTETGEGQNPETGKEETAAVETYTTGQILIIKGTDTPFYIPPTGIEVIPIGGDGGKQYVRDAVTLERLEYCILKNEKGMKKYIHGDAVVFPEPDELFIRNNDVASDKGSDKYKFKAIELSDTSGIYVKVISDYRGTDGQMHYTGDELFITGKEQHIYYPCAEHAIIDYDGQIMNHAIAIPSGEGRYILGRKNGKIKLVTGPVMYLPDPREEVVVRRVLSRRECELWYPDNKDVLDHNSRIKEDVSENDDYLVASNRKYSVVTNQGFSRSNTYTKPRTITIDNKFDGAVSINVWTGYAVNVISKDGSRKVITGPTTYLMEYNESLETFKLSTGKPKTTDHMIEDVYLRVDNNKVSDIINVQTKDFVDVEVKVSYCIDFLKAYKDKWFAVENYVKYMSDRQRSILKMEAKKYNIEEFYENATQIVREALLDGKNDNGEMKGRLFKENGMLVKDVEVLSVKIEEDVRDIMNDHQYDMVKKSLELTNADRSIEVARRLAEAEKEKAMLAQETELYKIKMKKEIENARLKAEEEIARMKDLSEMAEKKAEKDLQEVIDAIHNAELARRKASDKQELETAKQRSELDVSRQKVYTENMEKIFGAISEDLVAALTSNANANMLTAVATAMGPYAIAKDTSVADVTNLLLRGTPLDSILKPDFLKKLGKATEIEDCDCN